MARLDREPSPALEWHRECVRKGMKGRKFPDRIAAREALRKVSKECALKNPFKKAVQSRQREADEG